jgi:hypothetical protein
MQTASDGKRARMIFASLWRDRAQKEMRPKMKPVQNERRY